MTHMLELLSQFVISFIQSSGYGGIFLLMTLESALIPIPSEITMPFSGFLVSQGIFNFWIVVVAGAIGNLVGSLIAYFIGYLLEESVLKTFVRNYGKFILLTEHEYERAEQWFRRYGEIVTFLSRLLPAVRTFISLPAGVAQMHIVKFTVYTFIGSLLWSAFLTYIGVKLGENWHTIGDYFHKFDVFVVLGFFALIGWYLWRKLGKKHPSQTAF